MTSTINVPSHMLADVQAFMENLAVNTTTTTTSKPQAEVKSITNFTNTNNKYNFQLLFKDGSSEWVADEDTNCEQLISEFLHGNNINTTYLICRVSTKEQSGDTHVSLEAQEQELIRSNQELKHPHQNHQNHKKRILRYPIGNQKHRRMRPTGRQHPRLSHRQIQQKPHQIP